MSAAPTAPPPESSRHAERDSAPHGTRAGTDRPFTRADVDAAAPRVLNRGRWANATVLLYERGAEHWVIKDFRPCPFPYRHTLGRWMVRRELSALEQVGGIRGAAQRP